MSDEQYDVAFSFAGEDRQHAEASAEELKKRGISFFYDRHEKANLWGKDLYAHLTEVYRQRARFCIMFISKHYAEKAWTNLERQAAQARAFQENCEYILPVRLDQTEVPGMLPTVGYLSIPPETPLTLADAIEAKLNQIPKSDTRVAPAAAPVDWTPVLAAYRQKFPNVEAFLSISNSFRSLVSCRLDEFQKRVREAKISMSGRDSWPWLEPSTPGSSPRWTRAGVVIDPCPEFFWHLRADGRFLFCSSHVTFGDFDPPAASVNALLYHVLADLAFAGKLARAFGIAGNGGRLEIMFQGFEALRLIVEGPSWASPWPGWPRAADIVPPMVVNYDFGCDLTVQREVAASVVDHVLPSFLQPDGSLLLQQDMIARLTAGVQKDHRLDSL